MQQFIPFEDEWDILERLSPEFLIPYHVGVPCRHDLAAGANGAAPGGAAIASSLAAVIAPRLESPRT